MSLAGGEDLQKRGCEECRGPEFRHKNQFGHFDAKVEAGRKFMWNCFNRSSLEVRQSVGFKWAPELRECPWGAIGREARSYVNFYATWLNAKGTLQDILTMPSWVLQLIQICESEKNEVEAWKIEQASKGVDK